MKFFIVALMAALPNSMSPNGEAFIFTTETFKTVHECQLFAKVNMIPIQLRLLKEYGPERPPQIISCVNEKVVDEMLDPKNGFVPPKKEELI
tara:strand:+ start:102 stop:377 length:276 start_codon:yes stop_codon:yes gene_type:complete